jgi:hypothetical protein
VVTLLSLGGQIKAVDDPVYGSWGTYGPTATLLNANDLHLWISYDGLVSKLNQNDFDNEQPSLDRYPGQFPAPVGIIFAEGLLWGVKVDDGMLNEPRLRVNGTDYFTGLKAGKVLYDSNGKVSGSEDPENRHIWRVRDDHRITDLTAEAAAFFRLAVDAITATHIQAIFDQYEYDWQNWPASEGAPFDDIDSDGVYDPAVDLPGEPGATQTIWLVANDLPIISGGVTTQIADQTYGSPPIGIEYQQTIWAYDAPMIGGQVDGRALYKRIKLIYTGLPATPANAHIDTMYFTQWVDIDLGKYSDDFTGWSHDLDMAYVYNSNSVDEVYSDAGYAVPAIGYTLLQGPKLEGEQLRGSAFYGKGSGTAIGDPTRGVYDGSLEWFNYMEGFLPMPRYPTQIPFIDPVTDDTTKFTLDGDPIALTGWYDGIILPPGDRRFWMTTGPAAMSLGDTQEVVIAIVTTIGQDALSSLLRLFLYSQEVRQNFINNTGYTVSIKESDDPSITPVSMHLFPAYPNPLNPVATLRFDLPYASDVSLIVYDILGREVFVLMDTYMEPGIHRTQWNGRDAGGQASPSGIYFARLVTPEYTGTIKMLLLK